MFAVERVVSLESQTMRIFKLGWSDERKNDLVNWYVIYDQKPIVLALPFALFSPEDARGQLNAERARKKKSEYVGPILHVCLDLSSGRLYLPEQEEMSEIQANEQLAAMLQAARYAAERTYGALPMAPVIRGDPLHTFRIRRLSDFISATGFIAKQIGRDKTALDAAASLPVIEADMSEMPATAKLIPAFARNPDAQSAYVGSQQGNTVSFYIRQGRGQKQADVLLATQKTPFILINTAPNAKTSEADKERIVTLLYREFAS